MALDDKALRSRLAFIRYLYHRGVEQARQPHPFDVMSVLMFHDAVELFLHLVLEHHDPARKRGKVEFMQYFDLLPLKGRTSIDRLNTARVGLKHSGLPPGPGSVVEFPGVVLNFLEENCRDLLLGVDFSRVSMVDLVRSDRVRPHLQSAQEAIASGDGIQAMSQVGVAFAKLVDEHEVIGPPPDVLNEYPFRVSSGLFWGQAEDIGKIRAVVSVLALGLDFRRWVRFSRLTRPVVRVSVGEVQYGNVEWEGPPPSLDSCRECMDFVVESALRLESIEAS
jgi:hypothetical protein